MYKTKLKEKTYEQLEQLADLEDRSVSSLANEILRAWLDDNYEAIMEEELDEDRDDDMDEDEEDEEELEDED